MKKKSTPYVIVAVILLIIILFLALRPSNEPGEFDDMVNCLASKDIKMYGAYWCPHCNEQKELFGGSESLFKEKIYVECAEDAFSNERQRCIEAGITAYPTWIINGEKTLGTRSMKQLSELSGCEL